MSSHQINTQPNLEATQLNISFENKTLKQSQTKNSLFNQQNLISNQFQHQRKLSQFFILDTHKKGKENNHQNKEIVNLKNQLKKLTKQLQSQRKRNINSFHITKQLEKKIQFFNKNKKQLEIHSQNFIQKQISHYNHTIDNLQKKLKQKDISVSVLEQKEKQLIQINKKLKSQNNELKCNLSIKTKQYQKIQQIIQDRKKYSQEQIQKLYSLYNQSKQIIINFHEQLQKANQKYLLLQNKYKQLQEINNKLNQKDKQLTHSNNKYQQSTLSIKSQLSFMSVNFKNNDIIQMVKTLKSWYHKANSQLEAQRKTNYNNHEDLKYKVNHLNKQNSLLKTKKQITSINNFQRYTSNYQSNQKQIAQNSFYLRQRSLSNIKKYQSNQKKTLEELIYKKCKQIVF